MRQDKDTLQVPVRAARELKKNRHPNKKVEGRFSLLTDDIILYVLENPTNSTRKLPG